MAKKPRRNPYPGTYQEPDGTWRYSFDAPRHLDGRRNQKQKKGFPTQKAAFEAKVDRQRELRLNGYTEPTEETLQAYFDRWMHDTQHGRRASTNGNYTRAWRFYPEAFRALKLATLAPTQIRGVYAVVAAKYAPSTAQFARTILVMILKAAHRERLISSNPADGIKMPIAPDAETEAQFDPDNVWTVSEYRRFLAATADDPDHTLWRFLLDTGLRLGEALALYWDDLDFAEPEPHVRVLRTLTRDKDGREIVGKQPKTQSSRRRVSLSSETIAHLNAYRTAQKARRLRCGPLWVDRNVVFDAGDGSLLTRGQAYERFKRAVRDAQVRDLSPHGLRHTMAVTWLKAGKSPAVVAERLGHKSAAFALDVYGKVTLEWQTRDVQDVEAFIQEEGKPIPPPPDGTLVQWPEQG